MINNKKEDKKKIIIEAALEVLKTKNFQGMKTLDIAKEANIAEGSLYRYFKNKDAIFVAIIKKILSSFIEKTFKDLTSKNNFYTNLDLLSSNIYKVMNTGGDHYKLFLKAFSEIEKDELREVLKLHVETFTQMIQEIIEWDSKSYTKLEKRLFSDCIWGVIRVAAENSILDIEKTTNESLSFSIKSIGQMIKK